MACGTSIVKFILFGFNFLIVIGGVLVITAGALTLSGFDEYKEYFDMSDYNAAPITSIVFGSIVFLIAFMGCCGVLRENNCMLMTYAVTLGIIMLVEIGIVVVSQVYQDDFKKLVTQGFTDSRVPYGKNDEVTKNWDTLQEKLQCCGVEGYGDWSKTNFASVPESCCLTVSTGCSTGTVYLPEAAAKLIIYTQGCVTKVIDSLPLEHIVWGACIVLAVELLGIIFGCCLAARFKHAKYRSRA